MGAPLFLVIFLSLVLFGYGVGKLSRAPAVVVHLRKSGFPEEFYTPFGIFDLVLSVGLFWGALALPPLAFLCLIAIVPYGLLAFVFHARVGNPQAVPMLVFAVLAGYLAFGIAQVDSGPQRPEQDFDQFGVSQSSPARW